MEPFTGQRHAGLLFYCYPSPRFFDPHPPPLLVRTPTHHLRANEKTTHTRHSGGRHQRQTAPSTCSARRHYNPPCGRLLSRFTITAFETPPDLSRLTYTLFFFCLLSQTRASTHPVSFLNISFLALTFSRHNIPPSSPIYSTSSPLPFPSR